jgi:hypothetical protein
MNTTHNTKTKRLMNARFVAGLAGVAIPIMSLLGAASASADIIIVGENHNTVGKYNDLRAIVGDVPQGEKPHPGQGVVRPVADMAVRKEFPLFAAPFYPRELAAIGQSWDKSLCYQADSGVSERCEDHGH